MKSKSLLTDALARFVAMSFTLGLAVLPYVTAGQQESEAPLPEAEAPRVEVQSPESTNSIRKGVSRDTVVVIGKDAQLGPEDSANTVVAIGGSVKVLGKVREAAVAIAGDLDVGGEVEDAVAVLGNVSVLPGARVKGDAVAFGGKVNVADQAKVDGETEEVDFGFIGIATPQWLRAWFIECVLKLRPLAPQVPWVWAVAGGFFLLYLLITLLFPKPIQACVEELRERPATTFFMGILTKILVPLAFVVLAATGVGLIVFPFILAALLLGAIIGKAALLQALGSGIGSKTRIAALQSPVIGLVTGAIILAVLYIIPLLGVIAFGVAAVWGLGAAATAAFSGLKREMPKKVVTESAQVPQLALAGGGTSGGAGGAEFGGSGGADALTSSAGASSAAALPLAARRATFWERMGAAFLDIVLVSILGSFVGGPPLGFVVALAYFVGLWVWKGTTVGGVVLGLSVVRVDSQPLSIQVALVRGLAAAFSVVVLFLGFLWIAWDKEKQGWHDKVAGTIVIKAARATPLV